MEEIHPFAFPILLIQNNVPLLGDLRKHVMKTALTLKGIQSVSTIVLWSRRTDILMVDTQVSYPLLSDNNLSQF